MTATHEQFCAELEAARNESEDDYFSARPANDSRNNRMLFQAGFSRGFEKLWRTQPPPVIRPTSDDALIFRLHDAAREVIEQYEHRFNSVAGTLFGPIDNAVIALRDAFAKMTVAALAAAPQAQALCVMNPNTAAGPQGPTGIWGCMCTLHGFTRHVTGCPQCEVKAGGGSPATKTGAL